MEETRISNALASYQSIHETIMEEYRNLAVFAASFMEQKEKERLALPYHINIIDELHINENGHSRILLKLLQYQNRQGEYTFLHSLLQYINTHTHSSSFSQIEIKKPLLTQEEARIDLWLRDWESGYAIIFENKACDAVDQEEQLSRYIDKTIAEGFNKEKIFVVYLPSYAHEPDEQSWGNYKEEFEERYVNLSFRDDILAWLKGDVLPNIPSSNVYLYTAVVQYTDYLEGYFLLRTINNRMNMNLDNLISSHFELDKFNTDQERIKELQNKIDDMQEVVKAMQALKGRLCESIYKDWKKKTKELFPELHPCERGEYTGVSLILEGKKVDIFISEDSKGLYCQVEFSPSLQEEERGINGTCIEKLKDLLPSCNTHCVWKYISPLEFDEVFQLFVDVVNRCKQLANNG